MPRKPAAALRPVATLFAAVLLAAPAVPAAAQNGAGSAGAQILQMPVGARAASLSGAYTAVEPDADLLFYNPAGLAGLGLAGAASYERYVEDIGLGSAAAALRLGPLVLGAGAAFLDAGSIQVIEPDPAYGGQRGRATGETASARETAARVAVALPIGGLSLGAGAGVVASDVAGLTSSTGVFDVGLRYELRPGLALGAAARNLGADIGGDPLPSEARLGAALALDSGLPGIGVRVSGDLVHRISEGHTGLLLGLEGGLMPSADDGLGAVARIGYDAAAGEGGLGGIRFGAGISHGPLAIDYGYRSLEYFGAAHRLGVRWTRLR